MTALKLFASLAIAVILGTPAFAADPPAANAAATSNPAESPDAAAALEKARELRKRADGGDAAAMYDLAMLLAQFGPTSNAPDREHAKEWTELANGQYAFAWVNKAADGGHQPAIDAVCRIGADPLAPARMREKGSARCAELRAKYPAK
jgi:TPR repeat protein